MRIWFSVIILLGMCFYSSVSQTDDNLKIVQELENKKWQLIRLNETTLDNLIMFFGTPDLVTFGCSYEELVKANYSMRNLSISTYLFEYSGGRGYSHILNGPLGRATSTKVWVDSGKVVEVDWEYSHLQRDGAEASWKNDTNIETWGRQSGQRRSIFGTKKLANGGVLYVDCFSDKKGNCSDAIEVKLMPGK